MRTSCWWAFRWAAARWHVISVVRFGRVGKAVLLSAMTPFLLKTEDNPHGVDQEVFDGIKQSIMADRSPFSKGSSTTSTTPTSCAENGSATQALQASWVIAVGARRTDRSTRDTWLTDFRNDMPKIDVPTLVVHGDADRILPYEATAKRLPELVKGLQLVTISGGPHNIAWTHYEEVNQALLEFLGS